MATNNSSDRPSVSFCCEPGLYLGDSGCYADDSFSAEKIVLPKIYHSNLTISSMSEEVFVPRYGETNCFPNAVVYHWLSDSADKVLIYLFENGTIYVNHSINGRDSFTVDNYCLASRMTENGDESVVSVCLQPNYIIHQRIFIVNMIMPILSIPFIVAIFIIHAVLPEMRNVQGYIFRSYLAALLVMLVTTAEFTADPRCLPVIIVTVQLALLASFFWMTVMAFDIWWTFGGFGSLQRKSSIKNRTKFVIYSCYAWGIPSIITGTGAILDFLHVESTILIRPGINLYCRYTTKAAYDTYFVGPVGATTCLNVFFFAWTAIKIIRQKRATAQHLGGTDSQRHDKNKERFSLYLKLFIVMGISRIASIIAWRYYDQLPDYIWYCLVSEGNLQGPIVFIIYVWKPNTKEMLLNRLRLMIRTRFRRPMNSNDSNQPSYDIGGTPMNVITRQ